MEELGGKWRDISSSSCSINWDPESKCKDTADCCEQTEACCFDTLGRKWGLDYPDTEAQCHTSCHAGGFILQDGFCVELSKQIDSVKDAIGTCKSTEACCVDDLGGKWNGLSFCHTSWTLCGEGETRQNGICV